MIESILPLFKNGRPWANLYCCSLQKSDHEQITLDFFKTERRQWFACDSSVSLSKKQVIRLEKHIFLFFLAVFICQKSKSLPSLFKLSRSFLKIHGINSLSQLFTKEQPWANHSHLSLQKSRVGHQVLLRSERIVLLRSFKERTVLLRSFFEFLATYETQKNDAFFCVHFFARFVIFVWLMRTKECKEHRVLL